MTQEKIDEMYKKIGENVAKLRKERGMSQLELSLKLNHKSVSIVASAERYYRKSHFNLEHLFKISKILEVNICDLLQGV